MANGENAERGSRNVALVRRYVEDLPEDDRRELHNWALELLAIRNSSESAITKAKAAIRVSTRAAVARPLFSFLAAHTREVGLKSKRYLWDDRGWAARLGLAGFSAGAVAFGGQGAGIAALGGAIGVPLWLVVGAGGAFLGVLVDELRRSFRAKAAGDVPRKEESSIVPTEKRRLSRPTKR